MSNSGPSGAAVNLRKLLLPSGKPTKNYGTSPFLMGKLTISMAVFNSYVKLPEGKFAKIPA